MSEAPHEQQPLLQQDTDTTDVYPMIQMIRYEYIDTPLSYETLLLPDVTYTVVRPLEEKYVPLQRRGNLSVVFCFLLNRAYFLRDRNLATSSLSRSRAALCELVATKVLKEHAYNMLELALVLTTSWPVYSGADPALLQRIREEREDVEERVGNAIEIAIITQAKRFIKSPACQKVIDGIWSGKIVYQAESSRSILSDTYKRNPIHFYDPHKAPLLDHYRLKVPAIRSVLEYSNFVILFILFVVALEFNERDRVNVAEAIFMVYALGFTLEKVAAMQEHGIKVYFKGTWNGFDLAFVTLYCTYALMRIYGVHYHKLWMSDAGIDILAVIAVLMFPRLAFVTLKNNLMVLSLRAMITQFVVLMLIATFCFGGFLYALWTLSRNGPGYSSGTIAWWMLDLWFGLDSSGFENASRFHPIFGPVMMITYACLSNTLLLTVLVSILSHTFSTISDDAAAEAMFRRAVSTIEGVKADSLFSYQPPINLIALCIMLPASYILSPRWFHKVNVFMIRVTSFPILLLIAGYERQAKRTGAITFYDTITAAAEKVLDTLPRSLKRMTLFEGLMAGSDAEIDAIFELEDEFEQESALDTHFDAGPVPPVDMHARQRRQSTVSKRHVSGSSTRSQAIQPDQPSPSSSPRKAETSNLPNVPIARARLNSLVTNGVESLQHSISPLRQALAFPSLMADTQPLSPLAQDAGEGVQTGPAVSYGPATRRRLSSMVHQRSTSISGGHQGALGVSAGEPTSPPGRRVPLPTSGPTRPSLVHQTLAESPDEQREQYTSPEPVPARRAEGDDPLLLTRLDRMEDRQRRMEDLLVRLMHKFER
ncbi:unnamed protein product [Somion occarium]|uniref:Calcium channel YVC1 n=1 Tax=Somion occarium TaxID=3059160 RepID=A0ABP1E733_9APHY